MVNEKVKELETVLKELESHRVIIWASYIEEVRLLKKLVHTLRSESWVIDGSTPAFDRLFITEQFNRSQDGVLVANPAVAGEGLTILAPYVIYYSRGWRLGDRIQSLGRSHRPGAEQFNNVTVIDVVAKDTIDERVLEALEGKTELLEKVRPGTVRSMV